LWPGAGPRPRKTFLKTRRKYSMRPTLGRHPGRR
jgi:hypothetical protein